MLSLHTDSGSRGPSRLLDGCANLLHTSCDNLLRTCNFWPRGATIPLSAKGRGQAASSQARFRSPRLGIKKLVTYWSEIVEQHGPDVWRTAYRLLNHAEDANDCYQETFLQAVEYRRNQAVTCWPAVLRRIATARAMDLLRRRYRASGALTPLSMLAEEPTGGETSPDVRAQLRESMEQLRQALTQLPPRQADIFWLSEVELLSHRDIGEQLGVTSEQVGMGLHRAKRKLRKLLTERGVTSEVLR